MLSLINIKRLTEAKFVGVVKNKMGSILISMSGEVLFCLSCCGEILSLAIQPHFHRFHTLHRVYKFTPTAMDSTHPLCKPNGPHVPKDEISDSSMLITSQRTFRTISLCYTGYVQPGVDAFEIQHW